MLGGKYSVNEIAGNGVSQKPPLHGYAFRTAVNGRTVYFRSELPSA